MIASHLERPVVVPSIKSVSSTLEERGKNEIAVLRTYASLTNRFLQRILPVVGIKRIRGNFVSFASSSSLEGWEMMKDGTLYTGRMEKEIVKIDETLRVVEIMKNFWTLNSSFLSLYSALTSQRTAKYVFEEVFGSGMRSHKYALYSFGLPIFILNTLNSIIELCSPEAISKIKERVEKEVSGGSVEEGKIRLDYREFEEGTFSNLLGICYPILCEDLGEDARKKFLDLHLELKKFFPEFSIPGFFTPEIQDGKCYLVKEERAKNSFEIFKDLVSSGCSGLCITRSLSVDIPAKILWLGRRAPHGESVERMAELMKHIEEFSMKNERAVLILDGLEYLSTHYEFGTVLRFLHDLKEIIALYNARLIIPIQPKAFGSRELALLERDLEVLKQEDLIKIKIFRLLAEDRIKGKKMKAIYEEFFSDFDQGTFEKVMQEMR
jgi:hypothetical protein